MRHEVFPGDVGESGMSAAENPAGFYRAFGKRALDIALALLILPIVAPIIALIWFWIRRDGGPGFFAHERVGLRGRTFRCWKIRSMVADAEARLALHLASDAAAAAEWNRHHKLKNDPRITALGRFIRRTSLDELPQIWNVICGEMSFVGPRPVVPAELARYRGHQSAYLALRPGITGLWQVSGRNAVSYDERVAMDVAYGRDVGMLTDLRIILMTGGSVLNATGS